MLAQKIKNFLDHYLKAYQNPKFHPQAYYLVEIAPAKYVYLSYYATAVAYIVILVVPSIRH